MQIISKHTMTNLPAVRIIALSILLLTISGCSTYPSKFKCGDAKGLGCTMLRDVDMQIDSGQIEEVYKNKKCKSGICVSSATGTTNESLNLKKQDTADSYRDEEDKDLEDDNNLYF